MNKGNPVPRVPGSPTDLELMQYFDGELEEPRRTAVAAFLSSDQAARNKLGGLQITSAILQDQTRSLSAADGIAGLVMAKISAEPTPMSPYPRADAGEKVIPFPVLPPRTVAPANDNSRRVFAVLGALAVAAAAALVLWSRPGASPVEPAASGPIAGVTTPSTLSTLPAPSTLNPEIDAAAVNGDADVEHGVEVAAVNFGSHMGSIFYVPSGSIEAKRTTTVVWLADDAGE